MISAKHHSTYSIKNLVKKYNGVEVLQIEHLELYKGTTIGLVGNNGAGKTTLMRCMLDLIKPTSGQIYFEGNDISTYEDWKRYVGAYLDENMLLNFLTPDEYFDTLRKIYGLSDEDKLIHLELFKNIFNDELLGHMKYIRDLSKGNLKKVGIASAIFNNPQAVLLDEPFENLDPRSQIKLNELFKHLKSETNTTILISSHDINHIAEISDRIIVLEKGSIVLDLMDSQTMKEQLREYFGVNYTQNI
ncbi:MAG TPA: ABC transporter ATP-binding protein [Saprospiraceae bacterium]|nr:ABC transporter ATP-binding protein [Saprospiraceae bacterium]